MEKNLQMISCVKLEPTSVYQSNLLYKKLKSNHFINGVFRLFKAVCKWWSKWIICLKKNEDWMNERYFKYLNPWNIQPIIISWIYPHTCEHFEVQCSSFRLITTSSGATFSAPPLDAHGITSLDWSSALSSTAELILSSCQVSSASVEAEPDYTEYTEYTVRCCTVVKKFLVLPVCVCSLTRVLELQVFLYYLLTRRIKISVFDRWACGFKPLRWWRRRRRTKLCCFSKHSSSCPEYKPNWF